MFSIDNEFVLNQQKQMEYRQEVAANRLAQALSRENRSTRVQTRARAALGRQLVKLGQRLQ